MKITNDYGISDVMINAINYCQKDYENSFEKKSDYSATTLINPSWINKLKIEHSKELTQDASEMLWSLLGNAMHDMLYQANKDIDYLELEKRYYTEIDGKSISGKLDIRNMRDNSIEDYKNISVNKYLYKNFEDIEKQLNIYSYILERNDIKIDNLYFHAILKDWTKRKTLSSGYPKIPYIKVNVRKWSFNAQEEFIKSRIKAMENPSPCSKDEQWYQGDVWKVIKKGNKKATKNFDNFPMAEAYMSHLDSNYVIEKKEKEFIRCNDYCPVREFCKERR